MSDHTSFSREAAREGRPMTSDEQRADRWLRIRRDLRRHGASLAFARLTHPYGMDWARTVPFDTGVVHGPMTQRGFIGVPPADGYQVRA